MARKKILLVITLVMSIVLACFCIRTAYTTYLFPIYPDEIAERILLSRLGYDFPIKFDLMPMCHSISYSWPFIWYFPAFLEWIIHGRIDNLSTFRLMGVITAWLVFCLLTVKLCQQNLRLFNYPYKKWIFIIIALGCVLALMQIGVVPFYLVTLRPEQCILFYLSLLLILYCIKTKTYFKAVGTTIIFFIICSLLLYQHTKTIFFAPVLFIIAYRLFANFNKYVFTGLMVLLAILILLNYHVWTKTFIQCPNSDIINKIFMGFNINFYNITQNFLVFLQEIQTNILTYQTAIDYITFQATSEVNYLPSLKLTQGLTIFNRIMYFNYAVLILSLLICGVISYINDVMKKKWVGNNLITLLLFLCGMMNFIVNKSRHWYDAGYLWSLFAITFLFYISDKIPTLARRSLAYVFVCYLLLIGIFSQYLLLYYYEPLFKLGFSGPGISIFNYHHQEIKNRLQQLSDRCHIDKDKSKNLILDDLTYLYFQKNPYPLAYTYLFYGPDPHFLHTFYEDKFNIDGMIIRATFPETLIKKYAIQMGDLLCVKKKNIAPLFKEMLEKR